MTRPITLAPGEFYHLYNRGTDKRRIFMNGADYERFLALLYFANQAGTTDLKLQGRTLEKTSARDGEPLVSIASYCLMPNHFHLLVRGEAENSISTFMQKVLTGYTMYFNKRHERSGALFQGKFKATHVATDRYLSYLVSYIHLNPVKLIDPKWKETGITDRLRAETYLEQYRYSSFQDYRGIERPHNRILESASLPEYFTNPMDFKTHVTEWLTLKPE